MKDLVQQKIGIFTAHKAASMLLHKLTLKILETKAGKTQDLVYYSANNISSSDRNFSYLKSFTDTFVNNCLEVREAYNAIENGIIGLIRRLIDIDPDHKILVCLRDPRDGLVSMFHFFTKIHGGISEKVRDKRIKQGLSSFVDERSADYEERFAMYIRQFLGNENCSFLKYEDMFYSPEKGLSRFSVPFQLSQDEYKDLERFFNKEVDSNSAKAATHERNMMTGEYLTALPASTIELLNETFYECIVALGYSL